VQVRSNKRLIRKVAQTNNLASTAHRLRPIEVRDGKLSKSRGGLGRKVRDTNPFPFMSYNALAEVEDIEIGFETKLK
jgi:hypothetical protein